MSTNPDSNPPVRSSSALTTFLAVLIFAGLLFVIARALLPERSGEPGEPHSAVGTPAPDVEFAPLTDKKSFRLSDEKGKVVLINFWGTWCPPCRIEFPRLMEATKWFREREDFVFVSVCVPGGGESLDELAQGAAAFLSQQGATFPALYDPDSAAFLALMEAAKESRPGVPFTVVIDREGKFAGVWVGYQTNDEHEVARVIDRALETPASN